MPAHAARFAARNVQIISLVARFIVGLRSGRGRPCANRKPLA
jgi:hypothetical protein